MSQPALFTGARALVSYTDVNGKPNPLALALDVSVSVTHAVRQTYVLGVENAVDQSPVGMDCSCSVGVVIPINKSDNASETTNKSNTLDLGLEPRITEMLTSKALTIDIIDKVTRKVIASIREARFAGRSTGTGSQDVATTRLNFVGIFDAGYGGDENSGAVIGYDPANA